jgi:hypothetical protein
MWVNVGGDFLNLDHVTRIRFTPGWKNAQPELIAEVEVVINGVLQGLTRYRGHDADVLQAAVGQHVAEPAVVETAPRPAVPAQPVRGARDTLHEV